MGKENSKRYSQLNIRRISSQVNTQNRYGKRTELQKNSEQNWAQVELQNSQQKEISVADWLAKRREN